MSKPALDPHMRALLDDLAVGGWRDPSELSPGEARVQVQRQTAAARDIGVVPEPVAHVSDGIVPTDMGHVPIRSYDPGGAAAKPVVVFFHGGGWVLGDLDVYDEMARRVCNGTGAIVLSVDYRRAPEHPYPAAVDDCYAVCCWLDAHAGQLGGDPSRLVVAGDSAGGNLAAAVCLRARDDAGPALAGQVLIYPPLDATLSRPSVVENGYGYFLTASWLRWSVEHYLPEAALRSHPLVSPLAATDLSDLPPAVVITAGYDPVRDEGDEYAERLRDAGNRVVHLRYPMLIHGFVGFAPQAPSSAVAAREVLDATRRIAQTV